jgi:putative transposase
MVGHETTTVTIQRQCELLNVSRSSVYYKPIIVEKDDAETMNVIRDIYVQHPYYGYRRITVELRKQGYLVNHKRVLSLMLLAGIKAIYPGKNTSLRNKRHKVYKYLLKNLKIERPNQAWQVDITYVKIKGGFLYVFCLIDVFSRKIMGFSVSTFLDTEPCLEALKNALRKAKPEIINSDQGCQFTSEPWTSYLIIMEIKISMDGKGRWADNIYIERLWRALKYELVYLNSFETVEEFEKALAQYIEFYNHERPHQALNYHTPQQVYELGTIPTKRELFDSFVLFSNLTNMKGSGVPKYP